MKAQAAENLLMPIPAQQPLAVLDINNPVGEVPYLVSPKGAKIEGESLSSPVKKGLKNGKPEEKSKIQPAPISNTQKKAEEKSEAERAKEAKANQIR